MLKILLHPRHQGFRFATIAAPAEDLQIRLFGAAALADRYQMVNFEIGGAAASAATRSITHQYRHSDQIGNMNSRRGRVGKELSRQAEMNKRFESLEFHRLGRSDQTFKFVSLHGQHVVHSRGKQKQADEMSLPHIGKLSKALVEEQIARQSDLATSPLELSEIPK